MIAELAQRTLDQKTKPKGSLGRLEELAIELCHIHQSVPFRNARKEVIVFAGDHGIAREGVSAYPPEVTAQMVANYRQGGAAVNVLARLHRARVTIVDVGVAGDLPPGNDLVSAKIAHGTQSFLEGPAMSESQCAEALAVGMALVEQSDADLIALGEMGIGNTTAASALLGLLFRGDEPAGLLVGRGTGVPPERFHRKVEVVAEAINRYATRNPFQALSSVGGLEIAALTGAFLAAKAKRTPILVDGFIVTVAALTAERIEPGCREVMIFAHRSTEPGHAMALAALDAQPLLDLGMRLGEGSGATLAFGLVDAAYAILAEMASFESAGVSQTDVTP